MTTAQDQQSRAEFEAIYRSDAFQAGIPYGSSKEVAYAVWQAARALPATASALNAGSGEPSAGMEPFGYWHQGPTEDECDFHLHADSGDVSCDNCVKLYTAAQVQAMGRVPPGWRAVPVTLTDGMLHAATINSIDPETLVSMWQYLLAAATRPPAAQEKK